MLEGFNFKGVIAPVITPFGEDGTPDGARYIEHCQWLLEEGCNALLPFGTTSEANSLGLDERLELLEELVDSGVDPSLLMVGTGTCSTADTIILTQHALDLDCGGVLTLPPYYYKNPSEEGLFRFFADVIEGVGDERLKLYLYHIPPQAVVGFSVDLATRLVEEFPGIVVGLKDSSGDWQSMKRFLDADLPDFEFFPGSEAFMLDALRLGAAGCISANANLNCATLRQLFDNWQNVEAEDLQAQITTFRKALAAFAMIPSLKAIVAHYRDDPRWAYLRPPFIEMAPDEIAAAVALLRDSLGFKMNITIDV